MMSSRKSTPTNNSTPTKSEPVLFTPVNMIKKPELEHGDSDNFFPPAGYSADFLMNYIEGSTPSTDAEALLESEYQEGPKSELDGPLTSDALPEPDSISGHEFSTDATNAAAHTTLTNPQLISSTPIPTQPQNVDSQDRIIEKLQVACQALSNLGLPPVPIPADHPLPLPSQLDKGPPSAAEAGSSHPPSDDGAKFLLSAAAGSDPSEPKVTPNKSPKTSIGESDEDLLFLISNSMQILHNYVVNKDHLNSHVGHAPNCKVSKASGGGTKRSKKGQPGVGPERFALSALAQLLDGGVINVNCLISKERSHLMWHLYTQLQFLVMAPQFALPMQYQLIPQTVNGMMVANPMGPPTMGPPSMMMQQPPQATMPQQNGIPTPHQFLGRQKPGQYVSPHPMNPILMDQFKMYERGNGVVPVIPNPAFVGGYPGGNMPQPSHPMSFQQAPHQFMMNQPMVQMPYNAFPPAAQQTMYYPAPSQQHPFPMAPQNNLHHPSMPIPTNDFRFQNPFNPPTFGISNRMPVPPSRSNKRSRTKRSSPPPTTSKSKTKRTVVRPGSSRLLVPVPANIGAQRVPVPVTVGND